MTTKRITFPVVSRSGNATIRRNAETGIEIHSVKNDIGETEFTVWSRQIDGSLGYWGEGSTLSDARDTAEGNVEMYRETIAEAEIAAYAEQGERDASEAEPLAAAGTFAEGDVVRFTSPMLKVLLEQQAYSASALANFAKLQAAGMYVQRVLANGRLNVVYGPPEAPSYRTFSPRDVEHI